MRNRIFIDSSVWIDFFNKKSSSKKLPIFNDFYTAAIGAADYLDFYGKKAPLFENLITD